MALARTHSVDLSVDSTYIVLKDTTLLSDYTDEGLDPSTATEIIFSIKKDSDATWIYTGSILLGIDDLRDVNGLKITGTELGIGATITDDLWVSEMTYTIDGGDYLSNDNSFLISDTINKVAIAVISGDWKDSFNYRSKTTHSKYALKLKSWLDQLVLADENGLLVEGKALLSSLKSIL